MRGRRARGTTFGRKRSCAGPNIATGSKVESGIRNTIGPSSNRNYHSLSWRRVGRSAVLPNAHGPSRCTIVIRSCGGFVAFSQSAACHFEGSPHQLARTERITLVCHAPHTGDARSQTMPRLASSWLLLPVITSSIYKSVATAISGGRRIAWCRDSVKGSMKVVEKNGGPQGTTDVLHIDCPFAVTSTVLADCSQAIARYVHLVQASSCAAILEQRHSV